MAPCQMRQQPNETFTIARVEMRPYRKASQNFKANGWIDKDGRKRPQQKTVTKDRKKAVKMHF